MSRAEQEELYEKATDQDALDRQKRAGAPKCRYCSVPIRWGKKSNGQRIPIDWDPHEGGNVLLFDDGTCELVEAGGEVSGEKQGRSWTRHYGHMQTCSKRERR
jgi:hypothetical protein